MGFKPMALLALSYVAKSYFIKNSFSRVPKQPRKVKDQQPMQEPIIQPMKEPIIQPMQEPSIQPMQEPSI